MRNKDILRNCIIFLLNTCLIVFVQWVIAYLFCYEWVVAQSKFSKYVGFLFLDSFLFGLIFFYFGRKIIISVLCQWIAVFGLFLLIMVTRYIESAFIFPYEILFSNKWLLLVWCLWFALVVYLFVYNFKYRRVAVLYALLLISLSVTSIWLGKKDFGNRDYTLFNRGALKVFFQSVFVNQKKEYLILNSTRNKIIDSNKKILFMHFPKTAGRNTRGYLSHFYTAYDNGMIYSTHPETILDTHAPRFHLNALNLLDSKKFTFFRDPKKRLMSDYHYLRTTPDEPLYDYVKSITFVEYLKEKNESIEAAAGHVRDNVYVRNLVNKPWGNYQIIEKDMDEAIKFLEEFEFIGFMDDYDKDFGDLCDFLYVPKPLQVPRSGVSVSKEKIVITPEIERELDRLTKYDYIVYEAAKKVAARKRKECKEYGNGVCRMRIED